jgi:hypothetical protein
MSVQLDDLIGAIRAADGDDPDLAEATQLRVRRSLESRARGRHRLVGVMTTLAILFVGTVSWALATGQVSALWTAVLPSREAPREIVPLPVRAPKQRQAIVVAPVLPPESVPAPAPPLDRPPAPAPVAPSPPLLAPVPGVVAPPVETLYRAAHDLHFHGGNPVLTLRAWDAYLAAEPNGRFSVDARYNRALTLIRLGRYAEARAALMPFARGAVEPAGYRQREAGQLVERLAHVE